MFCICISCFLILVKRESVAASANFSTGISTVVREGDRKGEKLELLYPTIYKSLGIVIPFSAAALYIPITFKSSVASTAVGFLLFENNFIADLYALSVV